MLAAKDLSKLLTGVPKGGLPCRRARIRSWLMPLLSCKMLSKKPKTQGKAIP
jgi:hypothetical protein